MRLIKTIIPIMLLALCAGCAQDPSRQASPWITTPDHPQGRYLVRPPHRSAEPVALCFALHGRGGDAESYSRLWHEALEGRYLVVAPQAPPKLKVNSWISTWQGSVDRDYLLHVWDEVHANWRVDPDRTVVAGYSAGASAACLVASYRKSQISGLVLHGAGPTGSPDKLKGLHVFLLVGARDRGFGPTRAMRVRDRLTGLGIDTQMHIVERADHASVYGKVRSAAAWIMRDYALPD